MRVGSVVSVPGSPLPRPALRHEAAVLVDGERRCPGSAGSTDDRRVRARAPAAAPALGAAPRRRGAAHVPHPPCRLCAARFGSTVFAHVRATARPRGHRRQPLNCESGGLPGQTDEVGLDRTAVPCDRLLVPATIQVGVIATSPSTSMSDVSASSPRAHEPGRDPDQRFPKKRRGAPNRLRRCTRATPAGAASLVRSTR